MRLSVKHIKKDVLYIFSGRGGTWGGGGPHGAVEVIAQTESLNLFFQRGKPIECNQENSLLLLNTGAY